MVERISRSEQKRLFKQVETLARELTALGDAEIKVLPVDDKVKEIIRSCLGCKGGALKRQVKYLAKVLRASPVDELYIYLEKKKGSSLKENALFHEAERWRDVLINEILEVQRDTLVEGGQLIPEYESDLLEQLHEDLPEADIAEIRRVLHTYARTRKKLHHRELFRILKAAIESRERKV